jgi:GntR family transcriptional regulator
MKILAKSHRAWYKKGWGDPRFWCCRKEADATSMEESSCVERLREMLNRGVWAEGELLPSEYELARQLDVSRSEILEALMALEEEKYLVRHHGIGWVVGARPVFSIRLEELISVSDMITRSGCSAGTVFLDASVEKPDPWLRELLKLEPGEMVFRLEQVRTANGKPVVYCLDKFPASMAEDFHPCESDFLFQLFEKAGRRVMRARTRVEAIGYHERISSLLCSPPESSLLILRQLHYDGQDRPVLFSSHYFRSDQFSFQVERIRPAGTVVKDLELIGEK